MWSFWGLFWVKRDGMDRSGVQMMYADSFVGSEDDVDCMKFKIREMA